MKTAFDSSSVRGRIVDGGGGGWVREGEREREAVMYMLCEMRWSSPG